jgi:L-rhamnose isomerase
MVHLFGGERGLVALTFHVWESDGAQNTSSRSSPVQRLVDSLDISCANNLGSCKGLVV